MQFLRITITELLQINKSPKLLDFPNHPFRFDGRVTKSVPDCLCVPILSSRAIFEIAVTMQSSTCCAALQISLSVIRLIWLMQFPAGWEHPSLPCHSIPNTVNLISAPLFTARGILIFLSTSTIIIYNRSQFLYSESGPSWTNCRTSLWSLLSINCLWNWQIRRKISKQRNLVKQINNIWSESKGSALIKLNKDSVWGSKSCNR